MVPFWRGEENSVSLVPLMVFWTGFCKATPRQLLLCLPIPRLLLMMLELQSPPAAPKLSARDR